MEKTKAAVAALLAAWSVTTAIDAEVSALREAALEEGFMEAPAPAPAGEGGAGC